MRFERNVTNSTSAEENTKKKNNNNWSQLTGRRESHVENNVIIPTRFKRLTRGEIACIAFR